MSAPATIGRPRREYRLVIRRAGDFPDDIHPLSSSGNVFNYAQTLKRYWASRPWKHTEGQVQVREVTPWRPL